MRKSSLTILIVMLCLVLCASLFVACEEQPTSYSVTYVGGNGTTGTAPTEESHKEGDVFKLAQNTFEKVGYVFAGWNDGYATYEAGANYTMPANEVTFTAQWTEEQQIANEFTITFEVCGELVASLAQTVIEGDSVTLPTVESSAALATAVGNAALLGWKVNGEGDLVGATYTPTADTKFVAVLSEMPQVTFYAGEESDAASFTVDAVYENDGWTVSVPQCTFQISDGKFFVGWYGYVNGAKTGVNGDKIVLADFAADGPYVFYADWAANQLAEMAFYSFSANTYYAFSNVVDADGYYQVIYVYNAFDQVKQSGFNAWVADLDTVRYAYNGAYVVETKQDDAWVELFRLATVENLNYFEVAGDVYYKTETEHTVSVAETFGETGKEVTLVYNLGLEVMLNRTPDAKEELTGYATVNFDIDIVSYNGRDVVVEQAYAFINNSLKITFVDNSETYQAVVNFGNATSRLTLYGVVLTADATIESQQYTFRASFIDKMADQGYRTLNSFEVLEEGGYRQILSAPVSRYGDGSGSYIYQFVDQVGAVKTTYTARFFDADGVNGAYFTVSATREITPITVTIETSDGQYQAVFQYTDPTDVEITHFRKLLAATGSYAQLWASRFYYGANTCEKLGANVFEITIFVLVDDGPGKSHYEVDAVYKVTFVPATDTDEASLKVVIVADKEVTLQSEHGATLNKAGGYTYNDDGVRFYEITFTVNNDDEIIGLNQVVVYRGNWTNVQWVRYAVFTFDDPLQPVNGSYVFTGETIASARGGSVGAIRWHFRIVINSQVGDDGEVVFTFDLYLQNEITFEIDGVIIDELTVLVDEGGNVTLPTAEQIAEYLPEGATFNGWLFNGETYADDSYTTGFYPERAASPNNNFYPSPANAKFVANITKPAPENGIAGSIYVDWTNKTIWQFCEDTDEGHYVIKQYVYVDSRISMSATAVYYTVANGVYTIYNETSEVVATLNEVSNVFEVGTKVFYKTGIAYTYKVNESGATKDFTIKLDVTIDLSYGSYHVTFVGGECVYDGRDVTLITAYTLSDGNLVVQYVDSDSIYRVTIVMATMKSNVVLYGTTLYSADNNYKAEFSIAVAGGYNSLTFYVKKGEEWERLGSASSSTNIWNIKSSTVGNVTTYYEVRYYPSVGGAAAYFTVGTAYDITIEHEKQHKVTFSIDTRGNVTIGSVEYYDGGWWDSAISGFTGSVEKLTDNVFYVENVFKGISFTITFNAGTARDYSDADFTVEQGKVEPIV